MIQRSKLSDDKNQLKTIIDIGEKQVEAIEHFFKKLNKNLSTATSTAFSL